MARTELTFYDHSSRSSGSIDPIVSVPCVGNGSLSILALSIVMVTDVGEVQETVVWILETETFPVNLGGLCPDPDE